MAFWFQPAPPSRHVQLLAPTTSNVVYSIPFGFPLPENDCHHISLAKTEPRRLGLGFWPQLGPPSRLTPSLAPTTLNLVYFTPIGPPLPENKCPHVSLAKTEPGGSVLDFGSNSAPPHALPDCTTPAPQTQCTPAKWDPLYLKTTPPMLRWPKTEPRRLGFGFWLQLSPPLRIARSHPTTTSNPVNPTKIRSPVPEN